MEFVIRNGIRYRLCKNDFTAEIYDSLLLDGDIYIPRSIEFDSNEYIITSIDSNWFYCRSKISSIQFAPDSEIRFIKKQSLPYFVESITIPNNFIGTKSWSFYFSNIREIYVYPENKNFKFIENSMIVGKSDQKSDIFDSIFFVFKNVITVKIPPFIKYIKSKSFALCYLLQRIEFTEDSQLLLIEKKAFHDSSIESINIPANAKLQEGWCSYTKNLKYVELSPQNKNLCYLDDDHKVILGKSNDNQDDFDMILFASRDIKEVQIPKYIKRICCYAFSRCLILTQVKLYEDSELQSIGKSSFENTSIISLFIPRYVKVIEANAFKECNLLQVVFFDPNSELELIENNGFGDSSLCKINIPSHVKKIEDFAFDNCNLFEINFCEKSEVDFFGKYAFSSKSLESITIPNSVKKISNRCFGECRSLKHIIFQENSKLEIIGSWAFSETIIDKIIIPKHVKQIGSKAFFHCYQLQNIFFEEGSELHTIGEGIFFGTNLETFYFPDSLTDLQEGWCFGTDSLCTITVSPKNKNFIFINNEMLVGKKDQNSEDYDTLFFINHDIESVKIPSFIKYFNSYSFAVTSLLLKIEFSEDSELLSISHNAFNSSALESFKIPANVVELEENWCNSTECLIDVSISPNNKNFTFLPDQNKVILCKSNNEQNNFDVITFACRDIINVTIPNYVKHICSSAFSTCYNLKSVEFADSSELQSIGKDCFSQTRIQNIIIPQKVVSVGSNAFEGCYIYSVEVLSDNITFYETIFDKCDFFTIVSFPNAKRVHNIKEILPKTDQRVFYFFICSDAVFD